MSPMACRGVLFAITDDTVNALLAASSDEEVRAVVHEIEWAWDETQLAETDKSWDAMHRALTDGSTKPRRRTDPLALAILGGTKLHRGDDYIVSLVLAEEVPEVARALTGIDEAAFRARYFRLVPPDYSLNYGEEDAEYTCAYFADVVEFYARAAAGGRAVIFTVGL
jgi:hypothetical protein